LVGRFGGQKWRRQSERQKDNEKQASRMDHINDSDAVTSSRVQFLCRSCRQINSAPSGLNLVALSVVRYDRRL
jgi:hypothetical protein